MAFEITACVRAWCKALQGTVVAAPLQVRLTTRVAFCVDLPLASSASSIGVPFPVAHTHQPTPEIYNLFDDVLLLREGCIVYHGPRQDLPSYMAGIGFGPPALSMPLSSDIATSGIDYKLASGRADIAGWLLSVLVNPSTDKQQCEGDMTQSVQVIAAINTTTPPAVPTTTDEFVGAWERSVLFQEQKRRRPIYDLASLFELSSPYAVAQYSTRWSRRSVLLLTWTVVSRHWTMTMRNKAYLFGRLCVSAILSIIIGTV